MVLTSFPKARNDREHLGDCRGQNSFERMAMKHFNRTLAATMAATAIGGSAVSCTADPLNIKCSDYLTKTESEQLDLAARWSPKSREQATEIDRIAAGGYRKDFLAYCPQHPDDRLNELEISFGLR
jgi:hypothetical protein